MTFYLNINDPKYKKYDMDKVEYIMRYYYIPMSKKKKGHNKYFFMIKCNLYLFLCTI